MGLMDAPRGMRLHIGIFGRRNVGKSSLLNAITRQDVSIVSDFAGTTTDPVEKPMELLPLGPVLFIDTAGIDDVGVLGELRAKRTTQVFDRTDLGVLVTEAGSWDEYEDGILDELLERKAPVVIVSMTASAIADVPRGMDFLLNRNRVNVAISRGKWKAVIIRSGALTRYMPTTPRGLLELGAFIGLCESEQSPIDNV